MKKWLLAIIMCAAALYLAGCGAEPPTETVDGTPWSEDWLTLGNVLGVGELGHGLTFQTDLAAKKMHYASWTTGEARSYTTAEGLETELYDAQLVLLLETTRSAKSAQKKADEWLEMAKEVYTITDTTRETYNGKEFTVVSYTFPPSDINPFTHGISAFTVCGTCVVSAELSCQDTFEGNAGEILADVLEQCHYAAE